MATETLENGTEAVENIEPVKVFFYFLFDINFELYLSKGNPWKSLIAYIAYLLINVCSTWLNLSFQGMLK